MSISEQDYQLAIGVVREHCKASVSHLQRKLHWGYNRAAYAIDRMEKEFIVGPMAASGRREVLDLGIHELWQKAQMVPEGVVLVPQEPTKEQTRAFVSALYRRIARHTDGQLPCELDELCLDDTYIQYAFTTALLVFGSDQDA
jgi:hypothetical protein